jgi:hypothetical protein
MDDRKLSSPPNSISERRGADAAQTAPGVRRSADLESQVERLPADPLGEGSFVVYCGNAQQVSEGFAIALRAMGVGADILLADDAPPATSSDGEDI